MTEHERQINEPVKLEMTPMIDVVFLLLVFFMVTMKFRTTEGFLQTRLPEDAGMVSKAAPDVETIRLRLHLAEATPEALVALSRNARPLPDDAMGPESRFRVRFYLGEVHVAEMIQQTQLVAGQPISTARWLSRAGASVDGQRLLLTRLQAIHRQSPEAPLQIDPDRGTPYSALIAALEAGRRAGFSNVRFSGDTRRPR